VDFSVASRRSVLRLRWTLVALVALALTVWVFRSFGYIGFNPTDDGYVIAQSYRILHGAVPHRDLISPRPLGSAYLHTIDFAVPLPLMEASRLIATAQVVLYSMLFAGLIFERSPARWSVAQLLAAVGSTLVNLHSFPLMAWATIDGLGRDRGARVYLGLALVGGAALMKQSFAPVGAVALLWIAVDGHRRGVVPVSRLLLGATVVAAPMAVYAGAIALAGGLEAMRVQFGSVAPPQSWCVVPGVRDRSTLSAAAAAFGALRTVEWLGARAVGTRRTLFTVASIALAVAGSIGVVSVAVGQHLAYFGTWGVVLFWMLLVAVAIDACTARAFDVPAIVVLGMAWSSTLSWGYAVPNLLGGTMVLALLRLLWGGRLAVGVYRSWAGEIAAAAVAVVAVTVVGQAFQLARTTRVYFDAPAVALKSAAGDVIPAFGRIRTGERTGAYLRQLMSCLRQFDASRVAVIPDNPFLYPAVGIVNPLPIDWLWKPEVRGSEARLVEAALRLDREGDYLVLVQTLEGYTIPHRDPPTGLLPTAPLGAPGSPVRAITTVLRGTRTVCGSFVAIHAPRAGERQRR
jgi:hypothetical protein